MLQFCLVSVVIRRGFSCLHYHRYTFFSSNIRYPNFLIQFKNVYKIPVSNVTQCCEIFFDTVIHFIKEIRFSIKMKVSMQCVPSELLTTCDMSIHNSWKYLMNIFRENFYDNVQVVLVLTDQESRLRNALPAPSETDRQTAAYYAPRS